MIKPRTAITDAKITNLLLRMEHDYGKRVVFRGGEYPALPSTPTGIDELDKIIGGGIPQGRMMEIYGPESAGKTSLAYRIAAAFPKVLFIDAEGTFDGELAAMHGLTEDKLILAHPETGEQALQIAVDFVDEGCPLVIIDSVPALVPKALRKRKSFEDNTTRALVAGLMSNNLPVVTSAVGDSTSCIIFINQVRDEVGIVFGSPVYTPGGHALKHAYSLRLEISKKGLLDDTKLGDVGQNCRIRVVKSKVCKPRGMCELPLIWERGFVTHEEVEPTIDEMRVAAGFRKKRPAKGGAVVEDDETAEEAS